MAEAADTIVLNPAYWEQRTAQLAQILASGSRLPRRIADPTGMIGDVESVMSRFEAAYWGAHGDELASALRKANSGDGRPADASGVGSAPAGQERLTYTVEEAAAMLGISRAFAYEAVSRGEIPHIRIGRRILVPRSALKALIDSAGSVDSG